MDGLYVRYMVWRKAALLLPPLGVSPPPSFLVALGTRTAKKLKADRGTEAFFPLVGSTLSLLLYLLYLYAKELLHPGVTPDHPKARHLSLVLVLVEAAAATTTKEGGGGGGGGGGGRELPWSSPHPYIGWSFSLGKDEGGVARA